MVLRILCLHGMGVNAEIFALQTASLRATLPSTYDFVFVNGPAECEAAPSVGDVYAGPYRCWYNTPTTAKVSAAHDVVRNVMDTKGPFDGVMGFSQGAALAASMILHHQLESSQASPPLFRFAIFVASPLPFSTTLDYGFDTRSYFGMTDAERQHHASRPGCPMEIPPDLLPDPAYLRGETELEGMEAAHPRNTFYQMFHATVDSGRVCIPTAHVYGRQDPWAPHSRDLVALCEPSLAEVMEHDGGHEVPRGLSDEISDLIENTVAKARDFTRPA